MKSLLHDYFDKIICINLAERPDKRKIMQKKLDNLDIEVEWFTSVQYGFIPKIINPIVNAKVGHFNLQQPYEIGAALSHYTVVKQALLQGIEKLFVFEDDVKFHKGFNEKLDKYLDDIPENWEMMMFYSFMYDLLPENKRINKRWIKSFKSWSFMAYGMKKNIMEEYIKRQNQFFTISDAVTFKMQELDYNIYSAIPTLCIPETKLGSNIRGENQNYKFINTIINTGYSNENYE